MEWEYFDKSNHKIWTTSILHITTVKFHNKDHLTIKTAFAIKTTLAIKTICLSTKTHFSMLMGLINETCSLLRLLSTSTTGGLIIGISLYYRFVSSKFL